MCDNLTNSALSFQINNNQPETCQVKQNSNNHITKQTLQINSNLNSNFIYNQNSTKSNKEDLVKELNLGFQSVNAFTAYNKNNQFNSN